MSASPWWFVTGLLVPAVIAAAVMAWGLRVWRREACSVRRAAWAWPVAVGVGMLVAIAAKHGLPPADAWGRPLDLFEWQTWLGFSLVPMTLALVLSAQRGKAKWVGPPLALLSLAAAMVALLLPGVRGQWSAGETLAFVGGPAAGLAIAMGLGSVLSRRAGRELPAILGLTAVGAGMTIAFSGSESVGLTAVSLGAVMAGGGVVGLFAGCRSAAGAAPPALFVLMSILVAGVFYTYDPYTGSMGLRLWEAIPLAGAPLLGLLDPVPRGLKGGGVKGERRVLRAVLRSVVCLTPVAAITLRAGIVFAQQIDETAGYGY